MGLGGIKSVSVFSMHIELKFFHCEWFIVPFWCLFRKSNGCGAIKSCNLTMVPILVNFLKMSKTNYFGNFCVKLDIKVFFSNIQHLWTLRIKKALSQLW